MYAPQTVMPRSIVPIQAVVEDDAVQIEVLYRRYCAGSTVRYRSDDSVCCTESRQHKYCNYYRTPSRWFTDVAIGLAFQTAPVVPRQSSDETLEEKRQRTHSGLVVSTKMVHAAEKLFSTKVGI